MLVYTCKRRKQCDDSSHARNAKIALKRSFCPLHMWVWTNAFNSDFFMTGSKRLRHVGGFVLYVWYTYGIYRSQCVWQLSLSICMAFFTSFSILNKLWGMLMFTVESECKKDTGCKMGVCLYCWILGCHSRVPFTKKGKDERATPLTSLFAWIRFDCFSVYAEI